MASIQVIQRQPDPTAALATEAGNNAMKEIQTRQAHQLTLMELKQKAKMAENEAEKTALEKKFKILDYAFKLKDQGVEGPMLIKALHDFGGNDTWPTLAESGQRADEFLKTLSEAPGTGEREARQAKSRLDNTQADVSEAMLPRIKAAMGGEAQGDEVPPGTSISAGGVTMPLNARLTDTEQAITTGAENVDNYTTEFFNKFTAIPKLSEADKLAIDSNEPYLANGPLGAIQSTKQSLMAIIPFAKGGKQLTEGEKKAFSDLLRLSGKAPERIMRDYNTFRKEFKRTREVALGGSNAARRNVMGPTEPTKPNVNGFIIEEVQ